jgi:hypothetical protein
LARCQRERDHFEARVTVICAEPDRGDEPGTVAAVLAELGCRATLGRFDPGGLDLAAIAAQLPTAVAVEAGSDVGRARKSIKRTRTTAPVEGPIWIAVTVARLPALAFSIGFNDVVFIPAGCEPSSVRRDDRDGAQRWLQDARPGWRDGVE